VLQKYTNFQKGNFSV